MKMILSSIKLHLFLFWSWLLLSLWSRYLPYKLVFLTKCFPFSYTLLVVGWSWVTSMNTKGKSFVEAVSTEVSNVQAMNVVGESSKQQKDVVAGSVSSELKTASDGMNLSNYLNKLAKARTNFQKIKESSLMGRIFGDPIDFPKIRNKLLSDWKNVKGEVTMIPKGNYWFEISFANPLDKKRVWELRPFHVLGQLVILKQWKPNFNILTESVTELDLWVRIPLLPAEYANKEAIQTIIEENGVGKFIKLDPFSMNGKIGSYIRICINLDVDERYIIVDKVPIPDENNDLKEFPIWFEDFSEGCGHCRAEDHSFDICPLRVVKARKVRINFKRNKNSVNGLGKNNENDEEWVPVGGIKAGKGNTSFTTSGFRPYLSSRGGITINFQSAVSPGSSVCSLKNSKACSNEHSKPNDDPNTVNVMTESSLNMNELQGPAVMNNPPNDERIKVGIVLSDTEPRTTLAENDEHKPVDTIAVGGIHSFLHYDMVEIEFEKETENEVENDDVIAEFMVTGDMGVDEDEEYFSEHSFQSFNTVNMLLNSMDVKKADSNKSDSSKRKSMEVDDDTASSFLKGVKKQKK